MPLEFLLQIEGLVVGEAHLAALAFVLGSAAAGLGVEVVGMVWVMVVVGRVEIGSWVEAGQGMAIGFEA